MDETGGRPGRQDTIAPEAFPLQWPVGRQRTHHARRERGRFRTTFAKARDALVEECRRLGAAHVVISTNIPLRRDGLPYADSREPPDPGVAVYFLLRGRLYAFSSDRWLTVAANMQAITLTLEAIRGMERWGAKETVDQAFQGFQALPAPAPARNIPWFLPLGFETEEQALKMTSSESALRARYVKIAPMVRAQATTTMRTPSMADLKPLNDGYFERCRQLDMHPWWNVLGIDLPFATPQQAKAQFRERSLDYHPDRGGTDAAMARLNQAYEEACAALGV